MRIHGEVAWPAAAAASAAVVLGPLLAPGYPLRFDLVSVPSPVLDADALGLGDRLPRAVPLDAAVALLSRVLPDAWLTQAIALAALTLAGWGASRVARACPVAGSSSVAGAVALVVAVWNPFVGEQLAIGHVPHLLAYGVLPWVAWHGYRSAQGREGATPRLVICVLAGSLTAGGGILCVLVAAGAVTAGAVAAGAGDAASSERGRRADSPARPASIVALVCALQAPWILAGLLHPALGSIAAEGVSPYRVRAETSLGPLIDVLGLGGMWNASALYPGRAGAFSLLCSATLLGLAALGAGSVRVAWRQGARAGLVAAAALTVTGYVVALLPVLPGGTRLLDWMLPAPVLGLTRDGHRWLAVPALVLAVAAGLGTARLAEVVVGRRREPHGPSSSVAAAVTVAVCACVIAVQPGMVWGLNGRLAASHYPAGWSTVTAALAAGTDSARVVVLPWQPFRRFTWSGASPVLDPAPRLLPRQVVASDALSVDGVPGPAEGPASRAMSVALGDGALDETELRALGIGWILVERGTVGAVPRLPFDAITVVATPDVTLLRLPGTLPSAPGVSVVRRNAVLGAQIFTASSLLVALTLLIVPFSRRRANRRHTRRSGSSDIT